MPLLLTNLSANDIRVLRPFDVHCGEYRRVHGYRQRTGPFRVTWSPLTVRDKIAALQHKSFSATFWNWQHLYLLDALRQCGFPSFFLTISPYEWTFPWPGFIQELREDLAMEPTDLPVLETLHIAHVLEQVARGYLTRANTNRWRQHLFSNQQHPTESNLLTYFYRFEFQSRGTLHLHMLVWVKDLSLIRANLLHASISWNNANDAFLVADTQQPSSSSSSCLPLCNTPNSFIQRADGSMHLQFHFTEQDLSKNLRMHHNASWCTTLHNRCPASRWQGHVVEVRVVLCHENTRGGYSGRIVWQ